MFSIKAVLTQLFSTTLTELFETPEIDPLLQKGTRPELGDYQANCALRLAKKWDRSPMELAQAIVEALPAHPLIASTQVSAPGFINIQLDSAYLFSALTAILQEETLQTTHPQRIVIDYGGANVAKEMHIGHLRSALIGDALARIYGFLGHTVIRQNHLGDWGTQFGMLIERLLEEDKAVNPLSQETSLGDLNQLYRSAKKKFDEDPVFAERARKRVVLLQSGDPDTQAIWQTLVNQSEQYFQAVYERLDVLLKKEDNRGESHYNAMLPHLTETLLAQGVAVEDQGAAVIFLPGFTDAENRPLPLMIRKSDGGYLYATTDLAALQFRLQTLQADRVIYVVDARQKLHFSMLFAAAEKAGWVASSAVQLEHLAFGSILGSDKKPFKTRSGDSIRLMDVVEEAEKRAFSLIEERQTTLTESEKREAAHRIGVGALKYLDLSNDLIKDYVFDWEKMLSFDGNTAPYLQNAYVRIQSIFRKAGKREKPLFQEEKPDYSPLEHALCLKTLEFYEAVALAAQELRPHKLCHYLYELATQFHRFYEACPILSAEVVLQERRLILCEATAKVLKTGLFLLGILTVERM